MAWDNLTTKMKEWTEALAFYYLTSSNSSGNSKKNPNRGTANKYFSTVYLCFKVSESI